jgi:hypothetical protein
VVKLSDGMQRVRIGLTGLAFVFVLVLLAAVFTSPSEEQPITPGSVDRQQRAEGASNATEPKEPLAELGVAPGNADSNSQNASAGAK